MTKKSDLLAERQRVWDFLFDAIFHGLETTGDTIKAAIHHIGTLTKLIEKCDEE